MPLERLDPSADAAAGRGELLHRLGLTLVTVYFVARLVYLAFSLHPFVPPDEVDWFGRSVFFAETIGIPEDTARTARHGLIAHTPYLYFWFMGRVLALHPAPAEGLLLARLANIPLALASLFFVYRLSGLFLESRLARFVVLALFSNTLEVTALSATVTYDNLTHLLAFAMLYYLFSLFRELEPRRFLAFLLCAALGLLTKIAFLPLAAFATLALVARRWRSWGDDARAVLRSVRFASGPTVALATLALGASGLATWLYVENYVRFGRLRVGAVQALPLEVALENRIVRRSWVITQYRDGAISYERAQEEIARIPNRGNRNRARNIVERLRRSGGAPPPRATALRYAAYWTAKVRDRLFGFHGNGAFVVPPASPLRELLLPAGVLCLVAFAYGVRRDERRDLFLYAAAIAFAYAMVLLWGIGWVAFRKYGVPDFVVNGRYLIPVLPLLFCVGARYALEPLPARARAALATLVVTLFVAGDLPYLSRQMSGCWFVGAPPSANCTF